MPYKQISSFAPSDNVGTPAFGISMALSGDEQTLIVGGNTDNSNSGAAWIFTNNNNGTFSQYGLKLTPSDNIGKESLGTSVGISSNGQTVVIGGPNDNTNVGAVWIFNNISGIWTQTGSKLVPSDNIGTDHIGISVAMSSDGNTLLISGSGDNTNVGAVWIFNNVAGTWTQNGNKLLASDETGAAQFGTSVALSADGNTALIGGYEDNTGVGAVWIFKNNAGTWSQYGSKLIPIYDTARLAVTTYGNSCNLSPDGHIAAIGTFLQRVDTGRVFIVGNVNPTGNWRQSGVSFLPTGTKGFCTDSVIVTPNILLGSDYNNNDVWVYLPISVFNGYVMRRGQ